MTETSLTHLCELPACSSPSDRTVTSDLCLRDFLSLCWLAVLPQQRCSFQLASCLQFFPLELLRTSAR